MGQRRHSQASSRSGYFQCQALRLPTGRSGTSSRSVVGTKPGYTAPDFYYFIIKPQPEVTQRHKKGRNGTTSPATTPNPTSARTQRNSSHSYAKSIQTKTFQRLQQTWISPTPGPWA